MSFAPTAEQQAIREAFATGERLSVAALAGTGKTTTLKMLANDAPRTRMTYVAFNRAIADEARRTFPSNVTCKTMHAFAFAAVGSKYSERLNGPRVMPWQTVSILRIPSSGFKFGEFSLRDQQVARLVNEAIGRFCHSTSKAPGLEHIPTVAGMSTPMAKMALGEFLLPFVRRAWDDLQREQGELKFSHDVYLKLWAMGNPSLPGDVVLFDEAQDGDPVIVDVVRKQMERGARILPVGDAQQQIYEWRGATNALEMFEAQHVLPLQKSFRFGPAIAERANLILEALGTDLRLEGHEPVGSQLAHLNSPDAVLTRTNAEAVAQLMLAQVAGLRAGLVGGTSQVEALATAARNLMAGEKCSHPELMAFESWGQVQRYVEESKEEARDIAVLVKLVDRYGVDSILAAVNRAVPENVAELVISTAHKAKGREWKRVRLATDFGSMFDEESEELISGEARLQYVAVTRAMEFLDDSALGHLDDMALIATGEPTVRVEALDVPERVVVEAPVAAVPAENAQVICDPESDDKLVMHRTKYDPALVDAQRGLAGRRYRAEYCGLEKVNIVKATHSALRVAERFGLSVSPEARTRVEELGLA